MSIQLQYTGFESWVNTSYCNEIRHNWGQKSSSSEILTWAKVKLGKTVRHLGMATMDTPDVTSVDICAGHLNGHHPHGASWTAICPQCPRMRRLWQCLFFHNINSNISASYYHHIMIIWPSCDTLVMASLKIRTQCKRVRSRPTADRSKVWVRSKQQSMGFV